MWAQLMGGAIMAMESAVWLEGSNFTANAAPAGCALLLRDAANYTTDPAGAFGDRSEAGAASLVRPGHHW